MNYICERGVIAGELSILDELTVTISLINYSYLHWDAMRRSFGIGITVETREATLREIDEG